MIAEGVTPYATLFHWDLPQALQDAYGGFAGHPNGGATAAGRLDADFLYYANALFALYGDRVKSWMTFNEPWVTCVLQWGQGVFAPGIPYGARGQYACGHNLLVAHGKAAQLYRDVYKPTQKGRLGIALNIEWGEPGTDSEAGAFCFFRFFLAGVFFERTGRCRVGAAGSLFSFLFFDFLGRGRGGVGCRRRRRRSFAPFANRSSATICSPPLLIGPPARPARSNQ